jgi:N-acetylglucosamine kinase-like BadF-type ATPase
VSRLFLGVDGGQTSTKALIADESGHVLGSGAGGPCNHVKAEGGREKFVGAIGECLRLACGSCGLDPDTVEFEAAGLGFSGGPADKEAILREMLRARAMVLRNDAWIALTGATAGKPGIIVIAGTGSVARGRNAQGRNAQAGGWGYIYGDEGGAFDLVRQAVRAALRFEEGWGPATVLGDALLEATASRDLQDLIHRLYTTDFPRPRIAALARLVTQAAAAGDSVASELIDAATAYLAAIVTAVRGRLFQPGEIVPVAYIGGMFRESRVLARFRAHAEREPGNRVGPPVYGPGAGALLEAYRAVGLDPPLSGIPENEE